MISLFPSESLMHRSHPVFPLLAHIFVPACSAAQYHPSLGSILPLGDLASLVPPRQRNIAILEEPEHLTWCHAGANWRAAYSRTLGVLHTNYIDYAKRNQG
jgi:digalactosyldiacylglycerol synthase